ncbi:hypothetical protein LB577_01305 [Mesorhizobium sp. B283B1A]|uniref:hypothetical protein n=1 Tax=Mesorhizobium TaxID=68287 RepID=UPI001CD125B3|nr:MULTISPECIES: hypothetical protein [Mesorhizobium]MCA0045601.1 hypothetical protein [Mesorhizobium sp. B283B1A]UQS63396.1 hypothetical protein M5D98_25185 [Mesorhizobium opportunistum]
MKKADAEKAIRSLSTQWANTLSDKEREHPSFSTFKTWLSANRYGGYLDFRSVMGPDYDAEAWFDEELGQMWRR